MNIFCNDSGNILAVTPEKIYQNSAGVNIIRFIGQFPSSAQVLMAYQLPNGDLTMPKMLAFVQEIEGVQAPNGGNFSVWEGRIGASPQIDTQTGKIMTDENGQVLYDLDYTITQNYGTANMQFYVYAANGGQLATASTSFVIEKGVPMDLPDISNPDNAVLLEQILSVVANTQELYGNVETELETLNTSVSANTASITALQTENATQGENIQELQAQVSENTADIETLKTGSGNAIPITEKGQPNGVASLNAQGQVPSTQLPPLNYLPLTGGTVDGTVEADDFIATSTGLFIGETSYEEGFISHLSNSYAFPEDSGTIALQEPIDTQLALINQIISQSGIMYTADNTASWNERVTADGANVLDGSKAILKKVVGSTVACTNLFNPENIVNFGKNEYATFDEAENAYLIPAMGGYYYGGDRYFYEYQGQENTQYTFTADIKQGTAVNIGFVFHYADGTTSNVSNRIQPTEYTRYSATSEAGKTLTAISLNYQKGGSMYFKNARLNEGTADLGYQPYFTGLKSASFGGIESTNADGTKTSALVFPLTETPEGTIIDFEQKAVVVNGVSTPFTSAQLANLTFATDSNGNNLGAVYTIYNGGNESVQGNSNAEYLANNELTINYVYITEVGQ